MNLAEWLAPVVTVNVRQARRIRAQRELLIDQAVRIEALTERLRRIHADVELLGACLPREKRGLALALVRDRHRIEDLEETEAGWQ